MTLLNDSLDDLLGAPIGEVRTAVHAPASYTPRDFTETCVKCSGSGMWRGRGRCFACKGIGKLTFKTSAELELEALRARQFAADEAEARLDAPVTRREVIEAIEHVRDFYAGSGMPEQDRISEAFAMLAEALSMSPADLAKRIAALDWSGVPPLHQLAAVAVLETLKGFEPMTSTEMATGVAYRLDGEVIERDNVIALPVRRKTRWTAIHHLDGRPWLSSCHFGPSGAWEWIVESVAHEHGVSEDQIASVEGTEDQFDGDDVVTIDGLPMYRISTSWK